LFDHTAYDQSPGGEISMNLSIIADEGDVIRVRCEGAITAASHDNNEALENLLGPERTDRKVLLNLEKVRHLDSSGIGWLLTLHKRCKERVGQLVLYAVPPLILRTLEFLNLSRVLPIARDEAAARALVGGA
jgi:anti-anti-sigma factor